MINTIFKGWNAMRILRLSMAVIAISQGISTEQWLLVMVGALFALLPIFNVGCCQTDSCEIKQVSKPSNSEETEYEEVL